MKKIIPLPYFAKKREMECCNRDMIGSIHADDARHFIAKALHKHSQKSRQLVYIDNSKHNPVKKVVLAVDMYSVVQLIRHRAT